MADGFSLHQCLAADEDHAVFLTDYTDGQTLKAAIKIAVGAEESIGAQLRRWRDAAKLSHPNLVRIYATGRSEIGGTPVIYAVMECADESLGQVIPVRALTADEMRQTLEPALSALGYIHAQGLVHGHLKPSQIMAKGECLKIASAGMCRVGECLPPVLDAYSPPEKSISPAGDVWSLGVIMVEGLTQQRPGAGVFPKLAEPFDQIARRCLQANPKDRATANELLALFQPAKRRGLRWQDAVAALIGLAIAGVAIGPRLLNRHAPESQSVASSAPVKPAPIIPAPAIPKTVPPAPAIAPQPPARSAPAETVERVMPQVPAQARRTIRGTVKVAVRLSVDPSGKVSEARLQSAGPSAYFARLAVDAARRWKFTSLSAGSSNMRERTLHFEFSRSGTRAVVSR